MKLHTIELANTARFTAPTRVGPFTSGLNILAAPNETGKTTAIKAAARALFDRHSTKSTEIQSLQPIGTDLAPRITVEFETRDGHFRATKTFLNKPASQLERLAPDATWQLIAESDEADKRLQTLLHTSVAGRGATNPEHWGLFAYLWARQDAPAAWPAFADDNPAAQRIRSHLARIELDTTIETLRQQLAQKATALITDKGAPRANGDLDNAEKNLAALETELAAIAQKKTDLEDTARRHQQALAAVAQLEKEHTDAAQNAQTLREQATAAERLQTELAAHQQTHAAATEKLTTITTDAETHARHRAAIETTNTQIADAETATQTATATLEKIRATLATLHAERPRHETHLQTQRAAAQRIRDLLKLRAQTAAVATLKRQLEKASALATDLAAIKTEKLKIPAITQPKLHKLETLDQTIRETRAQLKTLGLTIELTPDHPTTITANNTQTHLPANTPATLDAPQTLDLRLPDWGRITIRSGSKETQNISAELAKAETDYTAALEAAAVPTLEAARNALTTRKDLDTREKAATTALETQLDPHETLDQLRETATTAERRAAAHAATLHPTDTENSLSQTTLETEEARLDTAITAAEKTLKKHDQQLDAHRAAETAAITAAHQAADTLASRRAALRTLETQTTDLAARYTAANGIAAAKATAQQTLVQAEARVAVAKRALPPDYEKLPARSKRAAIALQQIENDLQARRSERDEAQGKLATLGGQGLYTRETDLEEKRAEALLRRDTARSQAWSARIAHDLIQRRKQAATKSVLAPLEARLTAAFAELTGDATRRIYLDETLQIAGIGAKREETYPFDSLSQGAKEQLLLCLRLAVAQELATEEPQLLILDDVLVNTDPTRQARILDTLAAQTEHLQLLILTCHPDRYRGIGNQISFHQG